MIPFWLLALALVSGTLAFLLPPLLRARRGFAPGDSHSPEIYRARIAALEEEHRIGALDADDLAQAKAELARELIAEAGAGGTGGDGERAPSSPRIGRRRRPSPWLAVAIGVGVPLLAVVLYQRLGEPGALDPARVAGRASPHTQSPGSATQGGVPGVEGVEVMVARLAARLRSEPDNAEGWLLLGRSYMALERYPEAADAFAAAHRLLGDSAGLLTDLAEAEALAGGQNFLGTPGERLEAALRLEPEHPKALWLAAFAAMQRGDVALATTRWQSLLDRQPADSEAAGILRELIADAGGAPSAAPPTAAAPAEGPPGLTVNVTVADRLVAELDGSETLFVFARAAEGPPMPLAVVRRTARDLPLTVTLDDSMAMAPGRKLSDADRVVVGARISSSGDPIPGSGDLQGFSAPVSAADGTTVSVAITQKVP